MTNAVLLRNIFVGTATGYVPDGGGTIPERGKRFFSAPQSPDRL
jgi:hypothetical protein